MDTFGKKVLSGSVWVWDPLGIFLNVPTSLLDQVLVCLLAPGFIAMALYSHQGPYFCQIRSDFTLCKDQTRSNGSSSVKSTNPDTIQWPDPAFIFSALFTFSPPSFCRVNGLGGLCWGCSGGSFLDAS